jgi:thioredoxin 1
MIELNNTNFEKETKGIAIVDFWAPWCGPCRMMAPIFEETSKEADFKGKLKFAKLNTEEFPEIAEQYNITGIPCLIILKDGTEVDRIVGLMPKPALKEAINEIINNI